MIKWSTLTSVIIKQRRRLVMSLCSALFVVVTGYFIDSSPYSAGGEMATAQWIERISNISVRKHDHLPDSVLLVNVAYDKKLVDYSAPLTDDKAESRKLPAGSIDITDRRKLADFLMTAADTNYRYIMLDIRFDDDVPTDSDAYRLFSLIKEMPRIVFARHEGIPVSTDAPFSKSALSDYHTTMTETNMVKYPLVKQGNLSIPARMYEELNGGHFSSFFGLTTEGGALAKRSIFLTYPAHISGWTASVGKDIAGGLRFNYLNLGHDLLHHPDSADWIKKRVAGKIVVVGDFVNDLHETYIGTVKGPLINLNAFLALSSGRHKVRWYIIMILCSIYFFISYTLLSRKNLLDQIPFLLHHQSTLLRVVISFIGFSTILIFTSAVLYLLFGVIYSVVFPSLYFTLFNLWIQKRHTVVWLQKKSS